MGRCGTSFLLGVDVFLKQIQVVTQQGKHRYVLSLPMGFQRSEHDLLYGGTSTSMCGLQED